MRRLFWFSLCMIFIMATMSCSKNVGASLTKEAIGLVGKKVPSKGYYQDRSDKNAYYSFDFSDHSTPRRSYIGLILKNGVIDYTLLAITSEDEAVSRKEHEEVIAYLTKNGWVYDCEIPVGYSIQTYHKNKKGDLFVMMGEFIVASNASGSMFAFSAKDPYEVW